MLGTEVEEDEITAYMPRDQEHVIFLLLDGVGYSQYLWLRGGLRSGKSVTFSLNIFGWLKSFDEYNDKLILGSTLITDTASAFATIFSGKLPSETGVLASNMLINGEVANIKSCDEKKLKDLFVKFPGTFLKNLNNTQILVLDGSGRAPDMSSISFSKMLYDSYSVVPISPPDRIFKSLSARIDTTKKQLLIAYLPLIDRTGHSIGAFTSFESLEYEKLNMLLVEFLLDLAYNKKEIFDGRTTLVISADHGMFETSSKLVTLDEIKNRFRSNNLRPPFILINSRALLLYRVGDMLLEDYKRVITELLREKGISFELYTKKDPLIKLLLCDNVSYSCPDIVVLFGGDGVGLTQNVEELLLHHGGHGGCSCEEVFVPFITLRLTQRLYIELVTYFYKLG